MPHDTILRPAALAATALHPDQMIVFSRPPSLASAEPRQILPTRGFQPSPQHLFAVLAFGLGFVAGQIVMTVIR